VVQKVVAFVGLQASGKSEAAAVAREMSIPVVSMGDVIREETRARGLPPSEEGAVAIRLREEEGQEVVARRSRPKLEALRAPLAFLDGIRSGAEVDYFKGWLGDRLVLVRVEAPEEVRFERIRRRARGDDASTRAAFRDRDRREEAFGIRRAMDGARMEVRNDGDLEAFRGKVRTVLRGLQRP
jgi:dephospho-CoA kinase